MPEFLSFILMWVGIMAAIGGALFVTSFFRKKEEETPVDPKEYQEKFEEEMAEKTPEKPIKKAFRNPYVLSDDEIRETEEKTIQSEGQT